MGQAWAGVVLVIAVIVIGGAFIAVAVQQGWFKAAGVSEKITSETTQQVIEASKDGDAATVYVRVRDRSQKNVETQVASGLYVADETGKLIKTNTTTSATADTLVATSIGKTLTFYAYDGTYQMKDPNGITIKVKSAKEDLDIDVFKLSNSISIEVYNEAGDSRKNLSVPTSGSGTYVYARVKNNVTSGNGWIPLGGLYFAAPSGSNTTGIDLSGSATIRSGGHPSTNIVASGLGTGVTSRRDNWDYVFEMDDSSGEVGNQRLILEENDYFDTGTVEITANDIGCAGEFITPYAFTKGIYWSQQGKGIGFGHETDASTPVVISPDLTTFGVTCTA